MSAVAEDKGIHPCKQRKLLSPEHLIVRCMVFESRNGEYTAECIDLDIMARGGSPHDALTSLIEAVSGYLTVAFKGDPTGLVPRPSPLSHRARYHLFALRAAFTFGLIGARRKFLLTDWSPGKSCYC